MNVAPTVNEKSRKLLEKKRKLQDQPEEIKAEPKTGSLSRVGAKENK
jgi:hypothetical protein